LSDAVCQQLQQQAVQQQDQQTRSAVQNSLALCVLSASVLAANNWLTHYVSAMHSAVLRVRCQAGRPRVVVTREAGKNAKLVKALEQHNISCVELPLIEHAAGPDK
jgi:hypothetical protein